MKASSGKFEQGQEAVLVSGVFLFDLVSQKGKWLGVRAATVAGNVANANTPGYQAREIEPFSSVLGKAGAALAVTNAGHIPHGNSGGATAKVKKADGWETHISGNSVTVEQELMKAGEVAREHQLSVSILRSFHKMTLATVRSGS